MNPLEKGSPKIIIGWFAIAFDMEYGPELVLFKGEGKPTHEPETWCCGLDEDGIKGEPETNYVSLIDDTGKSGKPFNPNKFYRLRIEILEELEHGETS
jgi:hypothetical protein